MTLLDHTHGVPSNCEHPDCRTAQQRYQKRWRHDRHQGLPRTTDATPVRTHIAGLVGHGMSIRSIAGEAGTSASIVSRVHRGRTARLRNPLADRILAVQPGIATRTYGPWSPFVPRVGTVRRLQALIALGWTHTAMTARCGHRTAPLLHQRGRWVTRGVHDDVAAMYRRLCTRPGPSQRTRVRAAKLGYLPPVFWDDIDLDPGPDYGDQEVS